MKTMTILGLSLLVLWLMGCSTPHPPPQGEELVASDDVPDSVAERARHLAVDRLVSGTTFRAEDRLDPETTLRNARIIYVGTEVERRKTDSGAEQPEELYRVIHYRYGDDTAIHTVVNLEDEGDIEQQEFPHLPTPFTQQELDTARSLAMGKAELREALGEYVDQVVVEGLPIHSASENDPWFGRRVVYLLFKVRQDYLSHPRVVVDLTNRNVIVETERDTQ